MDPLSQGVPTASAEWAVGITEHHQRPFAVSLTSAPSHLTFEEVDFALSCSQSSTVLRKMSKRVAEHCLTVVFSKSYGANLNHVLVLGKPKF